MDCADCAFCGHEDIYSIANSMGIHLVASCFGGAANGINWFPKNSIHYLPIRSFGIVPLDCGTTSYCYQSIQHKI